MKFVRVDLNTDFHYANIVQTVRILLGCTIETVHFYLLFDILSLVYSIRATSAACSEYTLRLQIKPLSSDTPSLPFETASPVLLPVK